MSNTPQIMQNGQKTMAGALRLLNSAWTSAHQWLWAEDCFAANFASPAFQSFWVIPVMKTIRGGWIGVDSSSEAPHPSIGVGVGIDPCIGALLFPVRRPPHQNTQFGFQWSCEFGSVVER